MKLYIISGLAADSRVFTHIKLPPGFEAVHLQWISPQKKETLSSYSARLGEKIDTSAPFALLGLSMGGMIATEIAKRYHPAATILFSSVPLSSHLPKRFRLAKKLRLYKLVPVSLLKSASMIKRAFALEAPGDKTILRQVVKDSDPAFIRWAIEAILKWDNEELPHPLYHIHGTKDEILPFKNTKPTHIVEKGKHLMVMTRAGELNEFLMEVLGKVEC